jgi:hypothetical protein
MKFYKAISLALMIVFAVTGVLFLAIPDKVLGFFNALSSSGMPQTPLIGWNFYLILAVGYMYLVTTLAFLMFKHPENRYFALLLCQAKLVSSVLSLALFLAHAHCLIYLANFMIDGAIGIVVLILYRKMGKTKWVYS